jgi:phosphate uptake regulator
MRAAFDRELTELQARLVELGAMVQTQLDHALAVLVTGDPDAIQDVVGGDQQINQLRSAPTRRSPRAWRPWPTGCRPRASPRW